jgi:hypothetical protein
MPELAVIMSVYRNDKLQFVKESIQSILHQTFTGFDYFIVFDGPVSPEIEKYIASLNDDRIELYRREKNEGLASALNYLLEIVLNKPEYTMIARMDADDVSLPGRFEKQRNFLNKNSDVACVGCWYQEIDESGKLLSNRRLPLEHEALKKRYYTRMPFAHPSVMYRRELIEKAGFYPTDTILMEDNVLWGRALKEGLRFANIPEFLLNFRIGKDFYNRRSGFRYGWNYIQTKIKINNSLNTPLFGYLIPLGRGLFMMLPVFFLKNLYHLNRKYS